MTTSTGVKSFLHLTDPLILSGNWTYRWFDVSRQEFLLFRDNSFYLWAPCSVDPGPREFYSDSSWPHKLWYAKVSIDGKLLVVQTSKSSLLVLDITNRKRWKVDIKYLSGNEILENGLIWSEHGGNSQDLVIVTSRGLELYKVSSARGQCKLSRNVSIKIHFFWYEPNFRAILTAVTSRDYTLDVSGYFLRFDMSDMPRLELPPPDRMPSLSLHAGAGPEDITLATLYGALYCIVRYEEKGGDTLCLYHLSRNKVTRAFSFPLYVTSPVRISVTDNILCCHCLHSNMSFLFDIRIPAGQIENPTDGIRLSVVDYSIGTCTMSVEVSGPSPGGLRKNSMSATSSSSSHVAMTPIMKWGSKDGAGSEGDGIGLPLSTSTQSLSMPIPRTNSSTSGVGAEWSDAVGVGGSGDLEIMPDDNGTTGVSISGGYSGRSRHNAGSIGSPVPSTKKSFMAHNTPPHPTANTSHLVSQSVSHSTTMMHPETVSAMRALRTPPPRSSESGVSIPSHLRHAVEPYTNQWQLLSPYWVWDESTNCLWKVKCQLAAVITSMSEPRRVVGFLSRRGNPVEAPRPAFYSDFEDSYEAKKLLLRKMVSYFENGINAANCQVLFEEIVLNYALEYHQRENSLRCRREDGNDITGGRVTRNSFADEGIGADGTSPAAMTGDSVVEVTADEVGPARGMMATFRRMTMDSSSATTTTTATTTTEPSSELLKPSPKKFNVLGSMSLPRGNSTTAVPAPLVLQHHGSDPGPTTTLYTDKSSNRRASMNTQMIAAAHSARLQEYRTLQARAHDDDAWEARIGPLEPILAVDVFFPDILSIGSRAFGNRTLDRAVRTSAPPPVSTHRNPRSCLFCSQTEILSYVLLPIALRVVDEQSRSDMHRTDSSVSTTPVCTVDYLVTNLLIYLAILRTHDISVNAAIALLLINLLTFQKRFLDISHYVQLQFLSDSSELGMAILDISDSLEDELRLLGTHLSENGSCSEFALFLKDVPRQVRANQPQRTDGVRRDLLHAVSSMRQAGIDMLWRLNEKSAVVRWMLSHGRVSDAMILCTKTKGQWKSGLSPMGISGLDFFRSAMSEMCYLREVGVLSPTVYFPLREVAGKQKASWKTTRFMRCPRAGSRAVIADMKVASTEQQGVEVMRDVYHFLNTWDPSLLTVQKVCV